MPNLAAFIPSNRLRHVPLAFVTVIVVLFALPASAQCPASLSVSGPDANGMVTINSSTQGACGDTELDLTLDGYALDEAYCHDIVCSHTNTLFVGCMKAGAHTVGLTAKCGHYVPPQGFCDWVDPAGQNSSGFTVQPTPTVSLAYSGPDEQGHGTADVTFTFPYNQDGGVALFVDGTDIAGGYYGQSSTFQRVIPFTCKTPGAHLIEAKAYSCTNPTLPPPTDPDFIATDSKTITVAGQTQVSAKYDDDNQLLNLTAVFPNTDYSLQRTIHVYADGNEAPISWPVECTNAVNNTCSVRLTLSCGITHQVRVTAQGCGRSEPMYNAETTFNVAPVCDDNQTWCNTTPSSGSCSGNSCSVSSSTDSSCSSPPTCIGQPLQIASGDVSVKLPLFRIDTPAVSVPFTLTFHSSKPSFANTITYPLGPGWTHLYNQSVRDVGGDRLQLYTPTGDRFYFDKASPTLWLAGRPGYVTDHITLEGTTYVVSYQNGGKSTFDVTTGRWLSTNDRWANTISGTYDGGGNLTAITGPDGRQVTLEYTAGVITRVILPDGTAWRFEYTTLGGSPVLTAVYDPVHPTEAWRAFSYAAQTDGVYRSLTAVRDSAGKLLEGHSYRYDNDRAYTSVVEGGRESYLIDFDTPAPGKSRVTVTLDNNVTQVTDYTLSKVKGTYVATRIDGVCTSCGAVTESQTLTYDDVGHVLSSTDAGGHITRYSYDGVGNVLIKTEAAGTPRERGTIYAYEYATWPNFLTKLTQLSATGNGEKVTQYAWNGDETLLTTTVTGKLSPDLGSGTSYVSTTTFDAEHRIVSQDGPRADVTDVTTRTYYSSTDPDVNRRGRLQQITNAVGLTTTFDDYDVYGTARKITDPNGVVIQLQTDLRGRVTSTANKAVAGDPNETVDYTATTTYDDRDRVTETMSARGMRTRYNYEDGTNRLIDITRVDGAGNEVERKHFTLDFVGNKKKEEDQSCSAPAATCAAWVTQRTQSFVYDNKRRLIEIDQPVPAGAKVLYAYDSDGRLVSTQDENHTSPNTTYSYDELSRLATVTQTLGNGAVVTRYAYDAQDNLTSVTDPKNNVTTYAFDDFGRMQQQVSPVSGTTSYSYDPSGNLLSSTDANAAATTRTYDAVNRVLSATAARSGSPTETTTWSYDDGTAGNYGRGRLATMGDASGSTSYAYERRGLVRSEAKTIAGNSYTTAFAYDTNGNRSTLTYPSGLVAHYTFDFADRPSSLTGGSTTIVSTATYLPFGPLTSMTFGNGTTRTVQYDARYRPLENKLASGAGTIADYTYASDNVGNITQIHDATDARYNRDFGYDDLNRLTSANTGTSLWGAGTYTYDAMGNLLTSSLGNWKSTTATLVGTTPKLSSVVENGVSRSVTYDAAGNETSVGTSTYAYSPRNTLASVDAASYVYDGRNLLTIGTFVFSMTLNVAPSAVTGGTTAVGTVTLGTAATSDTTIGLSSNNPAAAVPPTVIVPNGQTAASFSVTTTPVDTTTTCTLTATANQSTTATSLSVLPSRLSALTLSPGTVVGGNSSMGTVTLTGPAASNLVVQLSSDNAAAQAPPNVTVAAGNTSATFTVTTTAGVTDITVTITATANGNTQHASLVFVDADLSSLTISPTSVLNRGTATGTVTLSGNAASNIVVTLSNSSSDAFPSPSSITIPTGATSGTFTIYTNLLSVTARTVTITATHGSVNKQATITVNPPFLTNFTINPSTLVGGDAPATGTATLNGPAPSNGYNATFTSSNTSLVATPQPIAFLGSTSGQTPIFTNPVLSSTPVVVTATDPTGVNRSQTMTLQPAPVTLSALTLSTTALIGSNKLTGTVTLTANAPSPGIDVDLQTSNSLVYPGTFVHVATGSNTATFSLQTFVPAANTNVTISAIHSATTKTKVLTVQVPSSTPYAWSLVPSGQTWLTGGTTTTLNVWINPGPAGRNTSVSLTSSNTAAATVPSSVTVTKGTSSKAFTVTTSTVTSPKDVTITASAGGTIATLSVIVLPPNGVAVASVSLYPTTVGGGAALYGAGTLTLTGPAPTGGVTVTLTGSRTNIITIEGYAAGGGFSTTSTFIGAGSTSGTILAQTYAFTGINRGTTITATYGGITRSGDLLVTAQPQASLSRHESVQCASLALPPCFMALSPVRNSAGDASGYYLYTPELHLMAETAISTATTKTIAYSYLWFGDLPVASVDATNTTRWYATDHLGTPLLMTDGSGSVVWHAEHTPYGSIYTYRAGATLHQPLRLPGQTAQDGNDAYYNIFRWYRSGWGWYTQTDPLGVEADINLYRYAVSNPIAKDDVLGLDTAGCDEIQRYGINETPCRLECCAQHDRCYDLNNCSSGSWPGRQPKTPCDLGGGCQKCNADVKDCFKDCLKKELFGTKDDPKKPNYYCGAQHRFINIPGDFSTLAEARRACSCDYSRSCPYASRPVLPKATPKRKP